MSKIVLVAAMSANRVIGMDNCLPWRLPDDLKHFKALTLGKTIVMGRKTWESLPGLLPDRQHVVITANKSYSAENAQVVNSLQQAIDITTEDEPVMVVGGANIYAQFLPLADEMHLTLVDCEIDGDAFFPAWDEPQWLETSRRHHPVDERHKYAFDFVSYVKNPQKQAGQS